LSDDTKIADIDLRFLEGKFVQSNLESLLTSLLSQMVPLVDSTVVKADVVQCNS